MTKKPTAQQLATARAKNTNCLEGIACPECGNHKSFSILMSSWFDINDDGTGDNEDTEWGDDSAITCTECQHSGTVAAFKGLAVKPSPAAKKSGFADLTQPLSTFELWQALQRIVARIDTASGSPSFTADEHEDLKTLLAATGSKPIKSLPIDNTGAALAVALGGINSLIASLEPVGRFILDGETIGEEQPENLNERGDVPSEADEDGTCEMSIDDAYDTARLAVEAARETIEQARALLNRLGEMVKP